MRLHVNCAVSDASHHQQEQPAPWAGFISMAAKTSNSNKKKKDNHCKKISVHVTGKEWVRHLLLAPAVPNRSSFEWESIDSGPARSPQGWAEAKTHMTQIQEMTL